MEDLELEPHPDFVKGFNEGYLLSKEMPQLADKLADALNNSERAEGFKNGREQYQFEQQKEQSRYPDWLRNDPFQSKEESSKSEPEKDNDLDRD